jgi:L-threonylcarbamoyladenylate synthase
MPPTLVIDPEKPAPDALERAAAVLERSGVIVYPTETFYALGARAWDPAACARVFDLKGRDEAKKLPLIAADLAQVLEIASGPRDLLEKLASRFWPGPLTLVVAARAGLGGGLAGLATLAVRVSGCAVARELARRIEGPITATSANRAGEPPAETAGAAAAVFGSGVDLLLDGGRAPGGAPSTIVDLTRGEPALLRPGPIDFREVLAALDPRA